MPVRLPARLPTATASALIPLLLAAPAAAQDQARGPFGQIGALIDIGGPIIAVLLVVSVIALAIILAKLVQFSRASVWSHGFVDEVAHTMHGGDFAAAEARLAAARGPVATVMRAALAGRARGTPDMLVREEVERIAQAEIDSLERGLSQLGLIATISPLLGLLGTVTGLIDSFQQLADAGDRVDPAILSGGIWEALLTTVVGLAIAIPAATMFSILQRTVDAAARRMEDAATRVFTVDLYRRGTADPERGIGAEGASPAADAGALAAAE